MEYSENGGPTIYTTHYWNGQDLYTDNNSGFNFKRGTKILLMKGPSDNLILKKKHYQLSVKNAFLIGFDKKSS